MRTEYRDTETSIQDLLNGGDWALAYGDTEALTLVCNELCRRLGGDLRQRAETVAGLAAIDAYAASEAWDELTEEVYRRLRGAQLTSRPTVH